MNARGKAAYTPARLPVLRWLTASGPNVPPHIRDLLLSEIFASQNAVIMGVLNGLVINTVAQFLGGGYIFRGFIVIDVSLAVCRIWVVRKGDSASPMVKPTPTDLYLLTAICWCALQGAIVFAAMRTGNTVLQVLGACTAMGLIGPICARNYPAPRYALLLVCLCDFPFVIGAMLTGSPWMMVILLQTPLLLLGCLSVIGRLHAMAVALLEAEYLSQQRAERDVMTGLLNRAELEDVLRALAPSGTRFVLFYLDLDGFKLVNDRLGHAAGDELLRAVAARLQGIVRKSDTVARLGGDEFVIVTPHLEHKESAVLASAIIDRITDQEYFVGMAGAARIGVSIGYACWPEDGPALDTLRKHADLALYEATKDGKGVHRQFVGPGLTGVQEDSGWTGADRHGVA